MKRVYTDPRFPGFEVHNNGDNHFQVYQIENGQSHVIDTFATFKGHPVTDEVAERRARDYFDRMSKARGMSAELAQRDQDAQRSTDFNVPIQMNKSEAPDAPYGLSASKDLDSLMGDNIMSADDVLATYEQVNQMPDGPEKLKAMERVKSMSAQLESAGTELVRNLLE